MSIFNYFEEYKDCEPAGVRLPKIKLEKSVFKDLGLSQTTSSFDVLKALSRNGIKERGIDSLPNKKEYYDRAKYELDTFNELGFVDYVLLNWEIIHFAKSNKIPVGGGRGSAAGSLVLFLLKITDIDPIPHDLYFERFISKDRARKIIDTHGEEFLDGSGLMDVDNDISYSERQRVIDFIEQKHRGNTCKILTMNTFSSKLCMREAVKYFNSASEEEAMAASDMIPKEHGVVVPISKAVESSDKFKGWAIDNKHVLENSLKVENLNKNFGAHPSGICISAVPVADVMPLQMTKNGELISGYDMNDVSDLTVKFDILGLRTLTIADLACQKIGIKLEDIDANDPFIYEILQDFKNPCGLFQISAETNYRVAQEVKPNCLEELSDVIALARPSSLAFVSEYIKQKYAPTDLNIHPKLDEILSSSKNVMLYQETLLRIAKEIFQFDGQTADGIRRAVGKKDREKMDSYKDRIFKKGRELNIEHVSEFFWNCLNASADYAFNKSHSAAYSSLAAKTVYLKFKYPKEFFCSVLETAEFAPDPFEVISEVARELPDFGIRLLPPNLEKSSMNFQIEGNNIRYGLSSIKGISQNTKKSLEDFVQMNPTNKYEVFMCAKSCGINIGVLTSLIYAGLLGEENRSKKVLEAQAFNLLTDTEKGNMLAFGPQHEFNLLEGMQEISRAKTVGSNGKIVFKDSRLETFKKKFKPYKDLYFENKKHEKLSIWWFEKTLLGYSFSLKLKDCFNEGTDVRELKEINDEKPASWRSIVQIDDFFVKISQNGNRYMKVELSDDSGKVVGMMCDSKKELKLTDFLDSVKLQKGLIAVVRGQHSRGTNFIDSIKIISEKIYTKNSQLKNAAL